MGSSNKKKNRWVRQWVGVFGGGAVGWLLTIIFPGLVENFSSITVVLWCAVIGGVLTSLGDFMSAGAALTHRETPWLNLAVGLGIPIILLVVIAIIFR